MSAVARFAKIVRKCIVGRAARKAKPCYVARSLIRIARKSAIAFSIGGFTDNGGTERIYMIREPRGNTNPDIILAPRDGSVTENGWMYVPLHRVRLRDRRVRRIASRNTRVTPSRA